MSTSGVLVIDKPEGPTSFDVVARVRRALKTREVGHCGTLDPLATGVVVVCVGTYTRLVRVLSADDKRYTATIAFGTSTTTDDREGEVLERGDPSKVDEKALRAAVASMSGVQMQVPPAYSAIHVDGERAYAKARRGEAVAMVPREVVVHGLSLLSLDVTPESARAVVDVHCGKGTYVRALARDIGQKLGVPAHLHALRRTRSGAYGLEDAVQLDELDGPHAAERAAQALRTGTSAVRGVPLVPVNDEQASLLAQGRRIPTGASVEGTALAHRGEQPIALVRVEDGALVVERGFGAL